MLFSKVFSSLLILDFLLDKPQFVLSKKGNPQLLDSRGYRYIKNGKGTYNDEKIAWYCSSYRKLKCYARVITDITSQKIVKYNNEHIHPPS